MATTSRSTAKRRSSTARSNGSKQGSGRPAAKRSSSASARKRTSGSARKSTSGSARKSTGTSARKSTGGGARARASSNGNGRSAVVPVVTAVAGAAAGMVGGVVFGRKRKPGLVDNVGRAAKQIGRLAGEVREARERAEKVGKALS